MAQVVEHVLGKDEVTSSNLVSSSKKPLYESKEVFLFCVAFLGVLHRLYFIRPKNATVE